MKLEVLSASELNCTILALFILLFSAFICGRLFEAIKAPKVIGEIFGGFILVASGPYYFMPELALGLFKSYEQEGKVLNIFYHLGLIFLMFVAGFNTRLNYEKANLKIISYLFVGATFLPILAGYFFIDFFKEVYLGAANDEFSFALVFLIAIAVTSIPVISKIFF